MKYKLTIDRFENNRTILVFEDGTNALWPKNKLPDNCHEGSVLDFSINEDQKTEVDKKEMAREILNEIMK
jgi:hypothetical protein